MESYLENNEEDREYLARREKRRARMLAEKRRRKKRQRIIKMIAAMLAAGIIVTGAVRVLGNKSVPQNQSEEKAGQETADSGFERTDTELQEETEAANTSQVEAEKEIHEEVQTKQIVFQETADTGSIYSENVNSTYGILVNADTDTIVAGRSARERISPASMTKVLTLLVAAENITEEALEDTFTMTLEITDYSYVNDCSNVGFLDGEEVKVKDLFYGTILPSGGDAAVGLAAYVAGSHEAFVILMNEKLEDLGLADSAHFTNCVGLYDAEHYCTAYDMAVIMKAALENELCREILAERCYTTEPTEEHPEGITISNWFLRRIEDKETGGEVCGAKTGFVAESGSCAVSYSEQENGTAYICVTAGAYSSWRCIYDHVEIYNTYAN